MKSFKNPELITMKKTDRIHLLYLSFFLLYSIGLIGQSTEQDTLNYDYYNQWILLKANYSTQSDSYSLTSKKSEDFRIDTNNQHKIFLSADYQFISFSFGFSPKIFDGDNDRLKGKSSFSDFGLKFFFGRWTQEFNLANVRGYYIKNTGDFIPNWRERSDPYIQIPTFQNDRYSGATYYIWNDKFSYKAIGNQTLWQKNSSGSWVSGLNYDYSRVSYRFSTLYDVENDYNMSAVAGYFYNLVLGKRWSISETIRPGLGIRVARNTSKDSGAQDRNVSTYFTQSLNGGINLSYNTERWIGGASFETDCYWLVDDGDRITNRNLFGLLYIGYRFGAPRVVSNAYKEVNNKIDKLRHRN